MSNKERYEKFAEFVFLVTGALLLIFSGHEIDRSLPMFFILFIMGMLCLCIRIEYTKEESA